MTKREVIQRLCLLMSRANNIAGWEHAADCICGESDDRRARFQASIEGQIERLCGGDGGAEYRNDGAALDVIESLINKACEDRGFAIDKDFK